MTARPLAALLLVAVLAGAECSGGRMPTSSVDDSTFVRTMVELQRLASDTSLDSLMRDSTRHVILRRHGLTADELVDAAQEMANDPDRAERVWTAINTAGANGKQPNGRIPSTPTAPIHIGTPRAPTP